MVISTTAVVMRKPGPPSTASMASTPADTLNLKMTMNDGRLLDAVIDGRSPDAMNDGRSPDGNTTTDAFCCFQLPEAMVIAIGTLRSADKKSQAVLARLAEEAGLVPACLSTFILYKITSSPSLMALELTTHGTAATTCPP